MNNALAIHVGYQLPNRAIITARGQVKSDGHTPCLSVEFNVFAGGFEGMTSDYMSLGHLRRFGTQLETLYQTLHGKAFLGTIDGKFSLELQGEGKVLVTAQFDVMHDIARLKFAAEIDHTFLPDLIGEVRGVLAAFSASS